LAIVTLGVRHPRGHLHANFVVAVLNDLFGIQARSGCFCAGPYIHRMYPIDDAWSARMHAAARDGQLGAKLAFTRLSFGYFISETAFRYVLDAVHLVADHGAKLLPYYRFDPESGLWQHRSSAPSPAPRLADALTPAGRPPATLPERALARQLRDARRLLASLPARAGGLALDGPGLTREFEDIRWFPLPSDAPAADQTLAGVGR
jgi:hypothetical protein